MSRAYEAPVVTPVGNVRDLLAQGGCGPKHPHARTAPPKATHNCGRCGRGLFSARWRDTGLLVHVEPNVARGDLEVIPELPGLRGDALPHVAKARRGRPTAYREHVCPSFSAASFNRKRRP